MKIIRVRMSESRGAEGVRRTARFDDDEIWWDIAGPPAALPGPLAVHDMAATALIFHAMGSGRDLHVDGPVSRGLLARLEEFVTSWSLWRPDLYAPIRLSAAEEIDVPVAPAQRGTAVAACSGGVDSGFTIWRHHRELAGRNTRRLKAAVFVHGLDIPLNRSREYESAARSAEAAMASIGLPFARVRTNWRERASRVWTMEFGAGLTACLRNWQGDVDSALMGSDEDYAHLVIPWGTNPITCALLSSPDFEVVWDGGGYGRTAKVEGISDWPEALDNLRVCWQNASETANCGRCEKCIRTKLNFRALGLPLPSSLPGEPGTGRIMTLRATNAVQVAQLQDIAHHARQRGVADGWLRALRVSILWNSAWNGAKRARRAVFPRRRGKTF